MPRDHQGGDTTVRLDRAVHVVIHRALDHTISKYVNLHCIYTDSPVHKISCILVDISLEIGCIFEEVKKANS